jgi:hypothetical protein
MRSPLRSAPSPAGRPTWTRADWSPRLFVSAAALAPAPAGPGPEPQATVDPARRCSGVEDPERKPAVAAGFRGGRYICAEASARGEWAPGGSSRPGFDAYATSKQCELATVFALARETPRLRFNAVEPGFNPGTGLGRDASAFVQFVTKYVLGPLAPFIKYWSTPKHAARVITEVLTGESDRTGVYYDENGKPMSASSQVRDSAFADRIVAETRALLATVPMDWAPAQSPARRDR